MSNSQINVIRNSAKRLVYVSPGMSKLQQIDLKPLSEKEILVETEFSGISRGTERIVLNGQIPKSEWERMRCPHQQGEFSFPVTYGYACVGKVIKLGSNVKKVHEGQKVFILHPHQERFIVDENWANPLPSNLDPSIAVLSANMETGLNAIWDARIESAHKVAVIGAGVVGLLTAHLAAKHVQTQPVVIDIDPRKKPVVESLGLQFLSPQDASIEQDDGFDRIFNSSASGAGLQLAIDLANFEAWIIEQSWYGDKKIELSLGGGFHSKRLQIVSSQVGHVSPSMRDKHSHSDRLNIAMSFLDDSRLRMLLNPVISFSSLPESICKVLDPKSDALCPLVTYMEN